MIKNQYMIRKQLTMEGRNVCLEILSSKISSFDSVTGDLKVSPRVFTVQGSVENQLVAMVTGVPAKSLSEAIDHIWEEIHIWLVGTARSNVPEEKAENDDYKDALILAGVIYAHAL